MNKYSSKIDLTSSLSEVFEENVSEDALERLSSRFMELAKILDKIDKEEV